MTDSTAVTIPELALKSIANELDGTPEWRMSHAERAIAAVLQVYGHGEWKNKIFVRISRK